MPVVAVPGRRGCYRWGSRGKVYCGQGARARAARQGRAAYANGYRDASVKNVLSKQE